jgi:predicted GTPase
LSKDLAEAPPYDVLLTELKGAAVDVAVRQALAEQTEVVFVNNAVVGTGIEEAFDHVLDLAVERVARIERSESL